MKSKYYIVSGELAVVILGYNAMDAAMSAIVNFPDRVLGDIVMVNQHGFDGPITIMDTYLYTEDLLSQLGLL